MALSFDPRRKRVRLIALTCGLCAAPLPAAAAPYRVEAISPVTAIVYEVDDRAKYRVIIGSTVEQLSALQIAGDTDTVTVRDVRSGKVQKITRATVPADSRSPWQRAWAQLVDVFAIQQRSGSSQGPATGAGKACRPADVSHEGAVPALAGLYPQRLLLDGLPLRLPVDTRETSLTVELASAGGRVLRTDALANGFWAPDLSNLAAGDYFVTVRSPRGAELTTYPLRLTMEAPPRTGTPSPLIEALLLAGEDNGSWRVQAIKQLIGLPPSEDRKALLNYLASGGTIDTLESFRRCNG